MTLAFAAATAIELVPQLLRIPILGRLLSAFQIKPYDETQALEQFARAREKARSQREKERRRNNKRVIKVSDAMQCVEDNLGDGKLALTLAKALVSTIVGSSTDGSEVAINQIFACFERKMLRQSNKRSYGAKKGYHRPARGHGKGRSSF